MRGASYAYGLVRLGVFLVLINAFQPAVAPIPFRPDLTSSLLGHGQDVSEATAPSGVQRTMQSVTDSLYSFFRPVQAAPLTHKPVAPLSDDILEHLEAEKYWLDGITFDLWGQGRNPNVDTVTGVLLEMMEQHRLNDDMDGFAIKESITIAEDAARRFVQARNARSFSSETTKSYVEAIQQAAEILTAELKKLRRLEKFYTFSQDAKLPKVVVDWLKTKMLYRRIWAVKFHPVLDRLVRDAEEHHLTFEMLGLDKPKRNWLAFKPLGYFKPIEAETIAPGQTGSNSGAGKVSPKEFSALRFGPGGGLGPRRSAPSSNKQAGPSGLGTGGGY